MSLPYLSAFLRRVLLADALVTGAAGLLMFLGAGFLAGLTDLPEVLLRFAGLVLLPYTVFVAYIATRASLHRTAVWSIVVINVLWVADSVALLLSGWVFPNTLGLGFVITQALAVVLFAGLQYTGIRRFPSLAG